MNAACCRKRGIGRWLKPAGSALPGALALLLPKCPLCIAAWVAAGTGIALPGTVAGSVRPCLAIACALLVSLALRRGWAGSR